MSFNKSEKEVNMAKIAVWSASSNMIGTLVSFLVRTIFIRTLGAQYLGLNGLFSNVLMVLSLADLGIASALNFRLYKPIECNDIETVGRLMNYYRRVYSLIAVAIFMLGMILLPFVDFFVNTSESIPEDVNLKLIFFLNLMSSVSSYLFVYRTALLNADQRGDMVARLGIVYTLVSNLAQVVILIASHKYILYLSWSVCSTIIWNIFVNRWIGRRYPAVFAVRGLPEKQTRKAILCDTRGSMCHKLGDTVINGTDNILLTKIFSLTTTGLYSNYAMIFSCIKTFLLQILGKFDATFGNERSKVSTEEFYGFFKRMSFINYWIAAAVTVCIYVLMNDFITVWLGERYLLDKLSLIILSANFYTSIARTILISFTNSSGLFVKDKIRPFIEAVINLIVSIFAAFHVGIAGIFIGTFVSFVCTVGWREPYILFHFEFGKSVSEFWKYYLPFAAVTVFACSLADLIRENLMISLNFAIWVLEAIVVFVYINALMVLVFHRTEICRQVVGMVNGYRRKQ